MFVTLPGIVTLVRLTQLENAATPILVTGRPLTALGIVTELLEQSYPVMVIVLSALVE